MSIHPPMSDYPLVSAVIPTRDRPALLACAMRSALRQTWPNLEVIVVVDGPDPLTEADLQTFADPRLRVIFLDERRGGSDARNSGVRAACGEWIAFLDDDDEWLPDKIAQQMRAAHAMPDWFPAVFCRSEPTSSRSLSPIFFFAAPACAIQAGSCSVPRCSPRASCCSQSLSSPAFPCIRTGTGSSASLRTRVSALPWSANRFASGARKTRAPR